MGRRISPRQEHQLVDLRATAIKLATLKEAGLPSPSLFFWSLEWLSILPQIRDLLFMQPASLWLEGGHAE